MSRTKRISLHLISFAIAINLTAIWISCGPPKPKPVVEVPPQCIPSNLTVTPGDHTLLLRWDTNCPDSIILSGYNIYVLPYPIYDSLHNFILPDSIQPVNTLPYPGDTNPEDSYETMSLTDLKNGVEYFVTVRTVFPDRTVSASSNEVSAFCRPEGEFTLDMRFVDEHDGFIFAKGEYARADSDKNDILYYRAGTTDYISSPWRLNGYNRKTFFYALGKTKDIYQYDSLDLADENPVDKMPIFPGESYLVKTADNCYAKIRVENTVGENRERKVHFRYIYMPTPNLMRF